jgi:hypothetical protein
MKPATRGYVWIGLGVVTAIILLTDRYHADSIAAIHSPPSSTATKQSPDTPPAPALPKASAKTTEDKKFEETKALAIGTLMLKSAMRNPDSFQLISASIMPKGFCYEYRAQNGFGGLNVESAVMYGPLILRTEKSRGFVEAWNTYCAGKSGRDLTTQVLDFIALANQLNR